MEKRIENAKAQKPLHKFAVYSNPQYLEEECWQIEQFKFYFRNTHKF